MESVIAFQLPLPLQPQCHGREMIAASGDAASRRGARPLQGSLCHPKDHQCQHIDTGMSSDARSDLEQSGIIFGEVESFR